MVLSQGFDPCINLYPLKIWQEMAEKHAAPLIAQEKLRRISRFIFSPAFTEELDKLGRILLPAPLRQYARITDAVIIAGVNTYIEIWGKENWDREKVATDEQGWQIAEGLERRE
jgi:MraZ protein